ncbi:YjjG family noncanonical pyrimidine nucleotidase [Psychrobacillus lasiicapitis]|uniref:Noncanonical pyrimidine nucleotidase, YjjG family n=1 Tax=Psychrobacillus lasiicapitis TaxID=1636719 RepID=A0A544SSE4_9BACI|nr:YjjG family noncanonical pyrimidine nucleotidase [Psychrobacillus lasiicapitis]TQR08141.1 noncanonical pyrimidine nucleotidase, YjjG family [Psychrobacillus lasiicapitis]GGA49480.1 noncanonical pyrimidine nucleotidase, YjjG family protein [Psychrobacillus lasiicapitis]
MNKYKHIIFDLDDTILDFQDSEEKALIQIIKQYELPYDKHTIACYKHINERLWHELEKGLITREQVLTTRFSLFLKEFHIDEDGEKVEVMYREHLNQGHKTVNHAHELLNTLSKQDYKLYIGTNGVGKTQRKRLRDAKLEGYFEQLFISEEMGYEKPNPHFFYYIFDALHISRKEEFLMIGDRLTSDIQGAINVGIDCVWFNPKKNMPIAGSPKSTYTVPNLMQIMDLLEGQS